MKNKLFIIALLMLSITSCNNNPKEDTQEVKELKQEVEDLKANVKELESVDKPKSEVKKEQSTEPSLISTLKENPNIDPQSIDTELINKVLNSPSTTFEKYISESAKNSGADEVEAAKGIIGYVLEVHKNQGIEISSVPIYAALQNCIYNTIYKSNAPVMQNATVDVGLEYVNFPINDFNLFVDKDVATNFKDFKKDYSLQDLIDLHENYRFDEGDPLMSSIINLKGEFGYHQEDHTYPGGIHVNTSIGGNMKGKGCYFFYVSTEQVIIKETQEADLRAMPVAYLNMPFPDMFDPNSDVIDEVKVNCLVTGTGLEDF